MKLMIDIPEEIYQNAKTDMLCGSEIIVNAIKNGTPTEQEPSEDCISRAETMTEIQMNARRYTIAKEIGGMREVEWSDNFISIKDALDILIKLPSVPQEPKTGWIPVSERLPENRNQEVLISLEWGIDIGRYSDGEWRSEWINHYDDGDVLAWMSLPEPYKESEEHHEADN